MLPPDTKRKHRANKRAASKEADVEVSAAPIGERAETLVDGEHDADEGQHHQGLNDPDHGKEYDASVPALKGIEAIGADLTALLRLSEETGVNVLPEMAKLSEQLLARKGTTAAEALIYAAFSQRVLVNAIPKAADEGAAAGGGLSTISLMQSVVSASDFLAKTIETLQAMRPPPAPKRIAGAHPLH